MTRIEVEAQLRGKKDKASSTNTCLNTKAYPSRYSFSKLHKFDSYRGNTSEHVACFFECIGSFANNGDLCIRECRLPILHPHTLYLNFHIKFEKSKNRKDKKIEKQENSNSNEIRKEEDKNIIE